MSPIERAMATLPTNQSGPTGTVSAIARPVLAARIDSPVGAVGGDIH